MIVSLMFLIIIATLAVLNDAYPFFAGTCAGGNPISLSPHPDGGSLGNGNLKFKLNGDEVPADTVIDVTTGVHQLELSGDLFNGFLFRLSSPSGINTMNKLIYSPDDARDQGSCDSNVAGITHFNAEPKSSITMNFDGSNAGNYTLDLTAGIGGVLSPPSGKWLYNQYNIRVSPPPPTPSPSQSSASSVHPSPEPSTTPTLSTNPSSPLSLEPSHAPSPEPSPTPTLSTNPSSPMSLEPSHVPTPEPSPSPTLSTNPSSQLTLEPSNVPIFSVEPSMEPTDEPSSPAETSSAPFKGFVLMVMASLLLTAPLLTA